ncbi:MAG: phage holin family protein [Archangium sp.]
MALGTQLREVVDAFSELVAQHVRLARLELTQDAQYFGLRVGIIAGLAPLIFVGWGFLCVALALLLRRVMPVDLAFLLVGLFNLVLGGVGIALVARQLSGRKVLDASMSELESTTSLMLPARSESSK